MCLNRWLEPPNQHTTPNQCTTSLQIRTGGLNHRTCASFRPKVRTDTQHFKLIDRIGGNRSLMKTATLRRELELANRAPPVPPYTVAVSKPIPCNSSRPSLRFNTSPYPHSSLSSLKFLQSLSSPFIILNNQSNRRVKALASAPIAAAYTSPADESEKDKLAQVSKRLEKTSRYFKRLGSFGFWAQLVCTIVSAVILSFSVVITGKITSPPTFYATAGGIAAAFISVFWSFGYIRLSDRLRRTANDPSKAPPRADVVKSLKNGIGINILGIGAAILGMQATVGLLVAKALTTSATPYYQGIAPGSSPVLALDVFLVQASANTILSHFLGLVCSLELLRSVTLPSSESVLIPKIA